MDKSILVKGKYSGGHAVVVREPFFSNLRQIFNVNPKMKKRILTAGGNIFTFGYGGKRAPQTKPSLSFVHPGTGARTIAAKSVWRHKNTFLPSCSGGHGAITRLVYDERKTCLSPN